MIPSSPYSKHYPAFLDYWVEDEEGKTEFELLQADINKTKEICSVLTSLTNHEIFTYDSSLKGWGIIAPNTSVDEMTPEELDEEDHRARSSVWMPVFYYTYDEFPSDRAISSLSVLSDNRPMELDSDPMYFTDNPIEDSKESISFPEKLSDALDTFYTLDDHIRSSVFSSMILIADGIKLGLHHQSLGFISFISSIETMVEIENRGEKIHHCKECGQPIFSVRKRFLGYLSRYVSRTESSQKKFSDLYSLRSRIAHTGKLFISDIEFSLLNREESDKEWFNYIEVQQLARLSLFRWLLLNKTK